MDFFEDSSSDFDQEAADLLYQLLIDLHTKGTTDIYIDPKTLLSSEVDTITAINRSAALEKEAQDILKVFTNAPVTPVLRDVNVMLNNLNERAVVPRNNMNIAKRKETYRIDIWKDNELISSIQNNRTKDVLMHFINIKIDKNGSFIITGLENVEDGVKEIIQELGGLIAHEDFSHLTRNENSVEIKEITESNAPMVEIPMNEGILKFTANQNPLDVLSEIYCVEDADDNKKVFKVPELGDFLVSADDDPIKVFKAITGHDLTDFYSCFAIENTEMAIVENTEMSIVENTEMNIVENTEMTIVEIPDNDSSEDKENQKTVKNTTKQHKKNKQKRKSKKRK